MANQPVLKKGLAIMTKDKSLKDKAIDIKGKKYVLVSDRIQYFNDTYPNGAIETTYTLDNDTYIVTAMVTPDVDKPSRRFIDHSQAIIGDGMVNKTAALENASTSAVGRALAYMGIGVIDSIASVDEVHKATSSTGAKKATEKQLEWMLNTAKQKAPYGKEYEWLEKLLTIKPEDVPVFKVKDAIDLIKKQPDPKYKDIEVEIDDNLDISKELENLPY